MKRIILCMLLIVLLAAFGGTSWAQEEEPVVTPTVEAILTEALTAEAPVVEVTDVVPVVEPTPEIVIIEQPGDVSETWFKPEHIIMLILGIGLAFSHPPQTGKLFGDIMKRVQDTVTNSPNKTDDAILLMFKPTLDQVQARLEAIDTALASVPRDNAVG